MNDDEQQPAANPPSGSSPEPASPFSRPESGGVSPQDPAQQQPPVASDAGVTPAAAQQYPVTPPGSVPPPPGSVPPPYQGPAQAFSNQPYPGQPYGAPPNPGQAFPPPPGAIPGQPTAQPPKSGNKAILVIGASIVAVILVIVLIAAILVRVGAGDGSSGQARSGSEAVNNYLNALASSDSATALSYAQQVPEDTRLLTDEVLSASTAVAPITDISITEPANDYSPIVAKYLLGDEPVTAEFYASDSSGSWKLESVTRDLRIPELEGIELSVNGVTVQGTQITVFPGSYSVIPTNNLYAVDGGAFVVTSPGDFATPRMELGLSSTGQKKLRDAAQTQLNRCLKKTSLKPAGCGFGIRANGTGAVKAKWSIKSGKNAMKNAKFRLDLGDISRAAAYTTVTLTVKGYDKNGRYVGKGTGSIFRSVGNLSTTPVRVTFE